MRQNISLCDYIKKKHIQEVETNIVVKKMREIARLVPSKSEADIIPKNASNHMASHGIERKKPLRQTLLKSKRRGVIFFFFVNSISGVFF